MTVLEVRFKVFLLNDIRHQDALTMISTFIDEVLVQHQDFLAWHKKNAFKLYSFNSFYPIEKEGIYHKGQVYSLMLRTVKPDLAKYLENGLRNHTNGMMKGLTCEVRVIAKRHLEEIYSLTPVMIKHEEGYWKTNISFEDYEADIKKNLIKKYYAYCQKELDPEAVFWNLFEITSRMPIAIPYKGIKMLGDKLSIRVKEDEVAQEIMYFSTATGLGEMNSRGFGFVNYHYF